MFATVLVNGAFGLVAIATYVASVQDVTEQIVDSTSAFPFMDVFRVATGSTVGAIGMTIPFIVVSYSMTLNSVAAASRQAWSFARDGGLPFSPWFHKITVIRGTPLPINAMISTLCMAVVIALINLGSTEAFNSIVSISRYDTYIRHAWLMTALTLGRLDFRRYRNDICPIHRLCALAEAIRRATALRSLVAWEIWAGHERSRIRVRAFRDGNELFPAFLQRYCVCHATQPSRRYLVLTPLCRESMNWGIAMFGGVAIVCAIYYAVQGRKVYVGPVARVKKD